MLNRPPRGAIGVGEVRLQERCMAAKSEKVSFAGADGAILAARLDLPAGRPRA